MALSVTLAFQDQAAWGDKLVTRAVLTVSGAAAYTDNGVALPSTWKENLRLNVVEDYWGPPVLMIATPAAGQDVCYVYRVDLTNGKVVLIGGAGTAAEDKPLEELPNAFSIAAASYTATLFFIGY